MRAEKAEEVVEFGTVFKNLILNLSGCKSRSFYGPRNHLCLLHSLLTELCRTQVTNSKIWVSMTIEMSGNAKNRPREKTHTWREGQWKQTFTTAICSTFCTNARCTLCLESINRCFFSQKAGLWRYSIKLQHWTEINNNNENIIYVNPSSDLNRGN